jgi:hypothetical protein
MIKEGEHMAVIVIPERNPHFIWKILARDRRGVPRVWGNGQTYDEAETAVEMAVESFLKEYPPHRNPKIGPIAEWSYIVLKFEEPSSTNALVPLTDLFQVG